MDDEVLDKEELESLGVGKEDIEYWRDCEGGLDIESVDVSTAFLNAELSSEDQMKGICTRPPKS